MTSKKKAAILSLHSDCYLCESGIVEGEAIEFDHVIALALGGKDTVENMRAAHVACHRIKTDGDMKAIAKAKRLEAKRKGKVGARKRKIASRSFSKRPSGKEKISK